MMKHLFICLFCLVALTRSVSAQTISTYASSFSFDLTAGITLDQYGNLYIADENTGVFRKSPSGAIVRIAGNGSYGFSGDGGPATAAQLYEPMGVAVDAAGNIYIADMGNERIRKIDPAGVITTFAGIGGISGVGGFSGDGGPAIAAQFSQPAGVAVDAAGNVYIADANNSRIRKVNSTGMIQTIAGGGSGTADGIPAISAHFDEVPAVAVDGAGNIYLADFWSHKVWKVNAAGILTTVAGTGSAGYNGDNIAGPSAQLNMPDGVAADASGNIYISDESNRRLRKVDPSGTITTIAGTGVAGYTGDGGPATAAEIYWPFGIAIASNGNVLMSDHGGRCVRMIDYRPHGPKFTKGPAHTINICSDGIYMDTFLVVSDIDSGKNIVWTLLNPPIYGTIHVHDTAVSTGAAIVPVGINYLRDTAYNVNDSFRVLVSDGTLSDTIEVHVICDSTEIVQRLGAPDLPVANVFPNPSSGTFSLKIDSRFNEPATVKVYNVIGGEVFNISARTNEVLTIRVQLPPGPYFVHTITGQGASVSEMIIR